MTKEISLIVSPREAATPELLLKKIRDYCSLSELDVKNFKIIRKSIDARKKNVRINLGVIVSDQLEINFADYSPVTYSHISENAPQVIIVGAGPAGLFAALTAIRKGLKPIVIERGESVDNRRVELAKISREDKVNTESNYCFGEGGAGAFSDGKLFTRSKKRGNIKEVLEILCQFGASEDILINSHPHIGSDKLPAIIRNIREKIIACGGEVRFNCKMTDIVISDGKAEGIITADGEFLAGPVFLATGHSARDVYRLLYKKNIKLEAKGLAIGVRLEHPQSLIDCLQYHSPEGRGKWLPPAEYNFVTQSNGRGVYSFCMCPGGVIVPAVSAPGQIVVNGMSASARSGKWANSGIVVELRPGDIDNSLSGNPLEMLCLQEKIEEEFSQESNGSLNAPAQRMTDFIDQKPSKDLPPTSYAPGIHPARLDLLFPSQISSRLREGLICFGNKCKGFLTDAGVMIGLESRTSSPVRIPRNETDFQHLEIENLYPVGEGAGYAGGIVSSAIDGMNSMEAYSKKIYGYYP